MAARKNEMIPILVLATRSLFVLRRSISESLAPKRMVIQARIQGIFPTITIKSFNFKRSNSHKTILNLNPTKNKLFNSIVLKVIVIKLFKLLIFKQLHYYSIIFF
jgi:hypothetical protein